MNIRRKEEHNYTGTSVGTRSAYYTPTATVTTCPLGHSNCKAYTSGGTVTGSWVSNPTKATKRVLPLRIRDKNHSHTYTYIANYTKTSKSVTVEDFSLGGSCPLGHSGCLFNKESPQTVNYNTLDVSWDTVTVSYIQSNSFNIRKKIKHSHGTFNGTVLNVTTVGFLKYHRGDKCPEDHLYCRGEVLMSGGSIVRDVSSLGDSSSSEAYE